MKDKNSLSIRLDPAALLSSGLNTQTDSLLLDEETISVLKDCLRCWGSAHRIQ
jgi:hypothetical protein